MVFKKKCAKCGNKIERKFNFCPWCGSSMKNEDEFFNPSLNLGFPFNAIVKQLEKSIEKEMKNMDSMAFEPENKAHGISIKISTGNSGAPTIRIGNIGEEKMNDEMGNMIMPVKKARIKQINISEEDAKKLSKLPQKEPATNVRRLADRIIYEIELPGVIDKKNIIISKLHNSIEIRAFSDNTAFMKLIPVSLPIMKHSFEKEKLILELKPEI